MKKANFKSKHDPIDSQKRVNYNSNIDPPTVGKANNKWVYIFRRQKESALINRLPSFCQITFGVSENRTRSFINYFIKWWERNTNGKGAIFTVEFLKEVYGKCCRFSVGHSFPPFDKSVKTNIFGLPSMTNKILPLLTGNINERRCALYLLQLFKLALVKGKSPSIETITKPFEPQSFNWDKSKTPGHLLEELAKAKGLSNEFASDLRESCNEVLDELFPIRDVHKRIKQLQRNSNKLHLTTKNGPNGPAIDSLLIDYIAIKSSGLIKSLKRFAYLTKNKSLNKCIKLLGLSGVVLVEGKVDRVLDSRLSIKTEVGGKTRYFAICDWFTQSAFKGLHSTLFDFLKDLEGDGTFDHHKLSKELAVWTIDDDALSLNIFSKDLTAATDRLPIMLQYLILKWLFGLELANLWLLIMKNRSFYDNETKQYVSYSIGQPMGALSSWAILALTHHIITSTCLKASKVDLKGNQGKGIIGDDMSMLGSESCRIYDIIMDLLGVTINKVKGYDNSTLKEGFNLLPGSSRNNALEIAKRVIINGEEITPGSPMLLLRAIQDPGAFPTLINDLTQRGMLLDNPLGSLVSLSKLSYKPNLALEIATFPPAPAPYMEISTESEIPKEIKDLVWFRDIKDFNNETINTMKTKYNQLLKGKLLSDIDRINDIAVNNNPIYTVINVVKDLTVYSKPYFIIKNMLRKQLNNTVNSSEIIESQTQLNSNVQVDKILQNIQSLEDLTMLLSDKFDKTKERNPYRLSNDKIKLIKQMKLIGLTDINDRPESNGTLSIIGNITNLNTVPYGSTMADWKITKLTSSYLIIDKYTGNAELFSD